MINYIARDNFSMWIVIKEYATKIDYIARDNFSMWIVIK